MNKTFISDMLGIIIGISSVIAIINRRQCGSGGKQGVSKLRFTMYLYMNWEMTADGGIHSLTSPAGRHRCIESSLPGGHIICLPVLVRVSGLR